MDRIIISVSVLDKHGWTLLYQFMKCILHDMDEGTKRASLQCLRSVVNGVCLNPMLPASTSTDVYSLYGEAEFDDKIAQLSGNTCFSIIYNKTDDSEDFTELVPFILLQKEFGPHITLGIDIGALKYQQSYKFKCSSFFSFYEEVRPLIGTRSLYFINERIVNKDTGEITNLRLSSLAGKGKSSPNAYVGKPSRRFLPLLRITEDTYQSVFMANGSTAREQQQYVRESIAKIRKDFEERRLPLQLAAQINQIFNQKDSYFSQWLESGYFYSYEKDEISAISDKISGIRQTIQIIKDCVLELVQNIIFHGGKEGLLYCVFDKKANISPTYQGRIPNFSGYDEHIRFLRIGVFDFGKEGVVDTFINHQHTDKIDTAPYISGSHLTFSDFYDPSSIVTMGLSRLDMRYAARLGIKTFVKTIFSHQGYFCVESNENMDGREVKKYMQTVYNGENPGLSPAEEVDFANGTHYEIIFPVVAGKAQNNTIIPVQRMSLLSDHFMRLAHSRTAYHSLSAIRVSIGDVEAIAKSEYKEEQIHRIEQLGVKIIKAADVHRVDIALDLQHRNFDAKIIFKIVAYLQLKSEQGFEKVILINAPDSFVNAFCDLVNYLLIEHNDTGYPVWSETAAIITISESLHAQIIWGRTKDELYFINDEFTKYYCKNFFSPESRNQFDVQYADINEKSVAAAGNLILPYDILVTVEEEMGGQKVRETQFQSFVRQILRKEIISKGLGFKANYEYAYIGNKIIVRSYYEADMMFQNNFFTERFAYLIAQSIKETLSRHRGNDLFERKGLVIIGYKQYSEFLLKAIQRALRGETVHLVIQNDDINHDNGNNLFNFGIDGDDADLKDAIIRNPDSFCYATIVPIGATLSTNDKIIAFFKQWLKTQGASFIGQPEFVYNHCVIVVRDKIVQGKTALEEGQKWKSSDFSQHLITTLYSNAQEVHYTVQVAYDGEEGENNWLKRLNDTVSFPKKWQDEQYVNSTKNSSINSQNLMGLPQATYCEIEEDDVLQHLFEMKDDIHKGHIEVMNSHHKYYIDTESFIKRKRTVVGEWLERKVRKDTSNMVRLVFLTDKLNILIAPNAERESDFVSLVNLKVFDGNALILYLDVNNWQNNIIHKLSFLRDIRNVRFHYVDQAFLTGETFHKSQSYLYSVTGGNDIRYDSVISLVNRLPYIKDMEIRRDVASNMFCFVNLHYPTERTGIQECELCRLDNYYKGMSRNTVLENCIDIINANQAKIDLVHNCKAKKEFGWKKRRDFFRLIITHEIYNLLSDITYTPDFKQHTENKLDAMYSHLCEDSESMDTGKFVLSLCEKIDYWYGCDAINQNRDAYDVYRRVLRTDKRISFLKVISSEPLSQYAVIRAYAQKKLLDGLNAIIGRDESCGYDISDLKAVKAILKSLSFLKSNALVRKDVLVGAWRVLGNASANLVKYKSRLDSICDYLKSEMDKLDDMIRQRICESQQSIFVKSLTDLHRDRKIVEDFFKELSHEKEAMTEETVIKDFSRDVQFFVKNAIMTDEAKATFLGELIRSGDEIADYQNIKISKTILSLKRSDTIYKNKRNAKPANMVEVNTLFEAFKGHRLWENRPVLEKEYTHFLVWLFYDNTTIIRNTLDNFSKEIEKDNEVHNIFYNTKGELREIAHVKRNIDDLKDKFQEKVCDEYYYGAFRPYLYNQDGIDFVEKLLYVAYAKLKLQDLAMNKGKITDNTKELMDVLSAIMGADMAFWSMRGKPLNERNKTHDYHLYPISLYNKDDSSEEWDYDRWRLIDNFYTNIIYSYKEITSPILPVYNMSKSQGENVHLRMHSLAVYVINDRYDKYTVASISFLYKANNPIVQDETAFRVKIQEYGRLLLLLKKEIDDYVLKYLRDERVFDLWIEQHRSSQRFNKIYANSAHRFNSVYQEMDEFDQLDKRQIHQMSRTWLFLANETISYFYANIETHVNTDSKMHFLTLKEKYVIDKTNTIGQTFSDGFICVILALLTSRWNGQKLDNKICINGIDINDFNMDEKLKNVVIPCHKHLLRTMLVECLNNSLAGVASHGHRGNGELKRVDITVTNTMIRIEDNVLKEYFTEDEKRVREKRFKQKSTYFKSMRCEEYSSTTLTTLQGVANYIQNKGIAFSCSYGFNDKGNFKIDINF